MKAPSLLFLGLLFAAVGCDSGTSEGAAPAAPTAGSEVAYAKVQAVFTEKCVGCHGANGPKAGLSLDSYEHAMKGGEDGPVVKAGDPTGSELIAVMRGAQGHKRMPPTGAPASEEQIKTVEAWIQAGAKNG